MHVHWTIFKQGDDTVEAQIFTPDVPNGQTILFCPGFPGMGAGLFEQRHAAALADAGYKLIVLRHNGMRLDGPHAPLMINNARRLMQGRQNGEVHLGGEPSTVQDWLNEPLTALNSIQDENIIVIGNSFGALAALWSLTSGINLDRLKRIILMAGAQGLASGEGMNNIMRIWKAEYISVPRITDKVGLDAPENTVATLQKTYEALPERMMIIPADIPLTYLVVARDEIIYLPDTNRFRAATGGRGNIVLDEIDRAYPDHGFLAHDMPDYPTENLLALLKG